MANFTRRAVLAALSASAMAGIGYALRGAVGVPTSGSASPTAA